MYKDQLQGKKHEEEKQEYIVLDEIIEKEIPKEPENQNVQQQEQQVPQTPASVVRRSTRLSVKNKTSIQHRKTSGKVLNALKKR